MQCPLCGSPRISVNNYGRRVGSALGGVAGVAGGMTARSAGLRIGASLGSAARPAGSCGRDTLVR